MFGASKLPAMGRIKIAFLVISIIYMLSTSNTVYADETAATEATPGNKTDGRSLISINISNADIRDVLSLIALSMDANIIYLENPVRVSISAKNIEPMKALEILLQGAGPQDMQLSYLVNGNLIIVGSIEKLQANFFNQMALTRFKLSYITPDELGKHLETLAIPVKKITLEKGGKFIWVQGTPQALAKVSSVIAALDRAENFEDVGDSLVSGINLTPFHLEHITADRLESLIMQLKIDVQTIMLDTNPGVLWINGTQQELKDVSKLISIVDIPESAGVSYEMIPYRMKNLTYEKLSPVISKLDSGVQLVRVGASQKQIWLYGERKDVDEALALIKKLDIEDNGEEYQFIIYSLRNISPQDAKERLEFLGIPGISVITLNYPGISRELLVKCPYDMIGSVSRTIANIDVQGEKIKAPVDYAESAYQLTKRKELISKMMDIPPENLIVSDNISRTGDKSYYILWTIDTPENIKRIKEMIALIDSP